MTKVLCIVRSSTVAQEIETQKKELIEFARTKGFNDDDMVFIEAQGASARSLNKKYIKMLEDIKSTILNNTEIKAVALWALNRLGRVESKLHELKEFFVNNKIQVYCKEPSFKLLKEDGTEDTAGSMMFSVYAAMVKLDTDEMFTKLKRGKKRNAEIGKSNGCVESRYGYMVDSNNYVVPNPQEAAMVNEIYDLYLSGKYSFSTLTVELRDRGFKPRGRKMTDEWLRKVLDETAYIGFTNWEGSRSSHRKFIPIMSKEKWDKVQALKASRCLGKGNGVTRESKHTYMCVGLMICPKCGGNYMASSNYYRCYNAKRKDGRCDTKEYILIKTIDPLVYEIACLNHLEFLQTPNNDLVEKLEEEVKVLEQKIEASSSIIKETEEKKVKVADAYIDGVIDKKRYKDRLGKIEVDKSEAVSNMNGYKNDMEKLKAQIESAKNPSFEALLEYSGDLLESEKKKMKEIVNQHIRKIWFYSEKVAGRSCKHIHIIDARNVEWQFLYFGHDPRKNVIKLYKINKDGSITPWGRTTDNKLRGTVVTYKMLDGGIYDELLDK